MSPGTEAVTQTVSTVVLVEGESDRLAIEALARRHGRRLDDEAVAVVAMGGATNVANAVRRYGPDGLGRRLLGLCDVGELRYFTRAFPGSGDLAARGLFVCDLDLEDELIRAIGTDAMQRFIEDQGELATFRTMQKQPAQRDRSVDEQLHRFVGTRGGRKVRYAPALVEALDLAAVPAPLAALLAAL